MKFTHEAISPRIILARTSALNEIVYYLDLLISEHGGVEEGDVMSLFNDSMLAITKRKNMARKPINAKIKGKKGATLPTPPKGKGKNTKTGTGTCK